MTPDRHLGAARVLPDLKPNLLITETTYASTIRDSKRAREREFLQKISDTINAGGKVLIPVFALGRVQELCILLETFWERLDLKVPIYCSHGLADKATKYYRLFVGWTNEKIKKNFVNHNMFDFKHIHPLDPSCVEMPGAMVVFSTPGMLHGGQSLKIFKKWCGDEKNMIIMPGYCTNGTVGAKVINGAKQIEMDGRMYDIKLRVEYMSFSAHADAKGIMQLIDHVKPSNVMFVHGENSKMTMLKTKVEQQFKIPVYKPANGETVVLETPVKVYVDISDEVYQRTMSAVGPLAPKRFCPVNGFLVMNDTTKALELVSHKEIERQTGIQMHSVTFSEVFECKSLNWKEVAVRLRKFDPNLQEKSDGLDLFDSELLILSVPDNPSRVEIIWDDDRENWVKILQREIGAEKLLDD